MIHLIVTVGLLAAAFIILRVFVRNGYKKSGRLTPFPSFLQLLLFLLHALSSYVYMDPYFSRIDSNSPLFIPAIICIIIGLALLLPAMSRLGFGDTIGLKADSLRQTGLYQYTRNPQIVASAPLYTGFLLLWPSWTGLVWLGVLFVILHIMVLTEEEHLKNLFGEEYDRYCKKVPRYAGFIRKNN